MTSLDLFNQAAMDTIHRYVVAAIIMKHNAVLVLRRNADDFMGGFFEFPSGEVEIGEDIAGALSREVFEETGLSLQRIRSYVSSFDYASSDGTMTRQFNFMVDVQAAGPVSLSEHDAYTWIEPNGIEDLRITASVLSVLRDIWNLESTQP